MGESIRRQAVRGASVALPLSLGRVEVRNQREKHGPDLCGQDLTRCSVRSTV